MAFPKRDNLLVPYSTNWKDRLASSAVTYGLDAADSAAYTAVHDPYIASVLALDASRAANVESRPLVLDRNTKRQALLDLGRELYAFVQANRSVPDSAKSELGVVVIDREPTPVPIPIREPVIGVKRVMGHNMELSVQGTTSNKARPAGTIQAQLFYSVGETPPASVDDWKWLANAGRPSVVVAFPSEVAAGSKVWLTGFWVNSRKETGPLSEPISTYIGGGVSQAA